eukprot:Rmarinus@m.22903
MTRGVGTLRIMFLCWFLSIWFRYRQNSLTKGRAIPYELEASCVPHVFGEPMRPSLIVKKYCNILEEKLICIILGVGRHTRDALVLQTVLRTLADATHPDSRQHVGKVAITFLSKLLSCLLYTETVLLQFSAHALANLSVDPNLRTRIIQARAPAALLDLLSSPEVDPEVKTMAARCLANLTLLPQVRTSLLSSPSFLPLLVSSLHVPYARLTVEVLALMSNVSLDCRNGVELVRRGALRIVFGTLRSKHVETQHMSSRLLRRLAAAAREPFLDEGGIKALMYMGQSSDTVLRRECVRIAESLADMLPTTPQLTKVINQAHR